jgi:hypothetical protein
MVCTLAYSETPKRNALRCARLAMICLEPALRHALHESWQDFLIFLSGKKTSSTMMMAKMRIAASYYQIPRKFFILDCKCRK